MPRESNVEKAHALALSLDAQRTQRVLLDELEVQAAVLFATRMRTFGELARLSADKPAHAILEVAGTCGVGQAKSKRLLEHGRRLTELVPQALLLLEAGQLRVGPVELLLWTTAKCTDEVLAEVGRRVVPQLVDCDAVDAHALVKQVMLEVEADLDAEAAQRRHAQARANRGAWLKPVEDGMVRIGAEVDALTGQRFWLGLQELTRLQGRVDEVEGSERTVEQRRADVLAELPGQHLALLELVRSGRAGELLGGVPAPRDGVDPVPVAGQLPLPLPADPPPDPEAQRVVLLQRLCRVPARAPDRLMVHIPMTTVLDLDNRSGWVEGLGPVSAHQARLLRPTAELQAVWVDAQTGVPLGIDPVVHPPVGEPDYDDPEQLSLAAELVRDRLRSMLRATAIEDRAEERRFPSKALRELVRIRDVRCTGPGCPLPASQCEQDHLDDAADGGPTAVWNLDSKTPRCHHAKHDGWTCRRLPNGMTEWTSPTGGVYVRRPAWRPPPPITKPLPPASLDRPDGGLSRTFGQAEEPTEDDHAEQPVEAAATDAAEPAVDERSDRDRWLDRMREFHQQRAQERNEPRRRTWHDDGPPPF